MAYVYCLLFTAEKSACWLRKAGQHTNREILSDVENCTSAAVVISGNKIIFLHYCAKCIFFSYLKHILKLRNVQPISSHLF